jgi:RNA polymerase sigma factor for flagellar operon FliA
VTSEPVEDRKTSSGEGELSPATLIAEGRALVRSLAIRIYRNLPVRVELEDLIAYGELGLAEAAREFDPQRGYQFSTFAYYRIRGEIYDGLAKMTWCSRARLRRLRCESMANEVLESERRNEQENGSEDAGNWFARTTESLSVVFLASGMDADRSPLDFAEDQTESAPVRVIHHEINQTLKTLVAQLPLMESRLIDLIYFQGYTLQDAGNFLGISKSWASRLHAKILENLAGQMQRMDLHD